MFEPEELMARIVDLEAQLKVSEMAPPAAEQLIACLEGEIAKRDARIEAQESQIKILQSDANSWQSGYDEGRRMGAKHAAPVSEAKAQGVVMPDTEDFCFCGKHVSLQMISGGASNHGYLGSVTLLIDGEYVEYTRLNAAPVQHAQLLDRSAIREVFMRNGFTIKEGQSDLKPYVYAAAEELLQLAAPFQQVSVPVGWRELAKRADDFLYSLPETDGVLRLRADLCSMLAAQAAPAADAGIVEALEMALEIGDGCSRGFLGKFQAKARAALAAHCAQGVV